MKRQIKLASECRVCELCGEPYCDDCEDHYADCKCPGPHDGDETKVNAGMTDRFNVKQNA